MTWIPSGNAVVTRRRTERNLLAVEAFTNFLSWGEDPKFGRRHVPPAWWAYAFGATAWCPPEGEW